MRFGDAFCNLGFADGVGSLVLSFFFLRGCGVRRGGVEGIM